MNTNQEQPTFPVQPVDDPILCSPYVVPDKYWYYDPVTGRPSKVEGRRPASYWIDDYFTTQQLYLLDILEKERNILELVECLRSDVKRWKEQYGYRNTTPITKKLLRYWQREGRENRLFFCQIEAVETVIYLAEVRRAKLEVGFKPDLEDSELEQLRDADLIRYACKMATGTGKTVVMAMLVTWTFCNRGDNRSDERFPDAVLAICPNLTIKERLQVLIPGSEGNYYDKFDLVPLELQNLLMRGKVKITNWHQLTLKPPNTENGTSYRVVDKGIETDEAYTQRVLGELDGHGEIMVLNDEGHHAYRPLASTTELSKEEEDDQFIATVWIQGLDRIQRACGIRFVVDMSATPFYLQGSGHPEGKPFEWIVSNFDLGDAIESGITKIPQIPIDAHTGKPDLQYFRLWDHIIEMLGKNPSPKDIYKEATEALKRLASQWKVQFDKNENTVFPNCMIVVCSETKIADEFHSRISGEVSSDDENNSRKKRIDYRTSELLSDFENKKSDIKTLRIDSKKLAEEGSDAADALRKVVSTIGKEGEPGEQIRCVVAVSMLNEGWDARNVTQILGLRAFRSHLLCEQVVGRGLRRISYDIDPITGLLPPEYVDIYGIPFSMIPFKGKKGSISPPPPPAVRVHALRERKRDHEIRFPNVVRYNPFQLRHNAVTADVEKMEELKFETDQSGVVFVSKISLDKGNPVRIGHAKQHTSKKYLEDHPLQTTLFKIVEEILPKLPMKMEMPIRLQLFPQIFQLVQVYVDQNIDFGDNDERLLWDMKYREHVVDMFVDAIEPNKEAGEAPILPIVDLIKPVISSKDVDFLTTKNCYPTKKSHVNFVAVDSGWEKEAAEILEHSNLVESYVRNERLGLVIPYHFEDSERDYYPDFIVRLKGKLNLILEIKGKETQKDRAKYQAARRWTEAVNHARKYGEWKYAKCRKLARLGDILRDILTSS